MPEPDHIFVYGSLRPSQKHYMQRFLRSYAQYCGPARVSGELYDLGAYPAFISGQGAVQGDVYRILNAPTLLAALDLYEGDEYSREVINVTPDDAWPRPAWIYVYNGSLAGARRIDSGDYARYREIT